MTVKTTEQDVLLASKTITLDDNFIIRIASENSQNYAQVQAGVKRFGKLVKEVQRAGQPVLVLIDLRHTKSVRLPSRKSFGMFLCPDVNYIACVTGSSLMNYMVKIGSMAVGYKNIRAFETEAAAMEFLMNLKKASTKE